MGIYYSPKIVTDNLTLYLDPANKRSYSGSGSAFNDLSKYRNNGILTGGTFSNDGNGSILLNGTSDYVRVPDSSSIRPVTNISFEMWVKFNSVTNEATAISLFNKRLNSTNIEYFIFVFVSTGGVLTFDYDSTSATRWTTTYAPGTGQWIHFAFTRNASNRFFYLNGNYIASDSAGVISSSTNDLYIGKDTGASTQYYLSGYLGAMRIYNKTLTSQEVRQNYHALKGRYV